MIDPPDPPEFDPAPGPDEHDADLFDDEHAVVDVIDCPACGAGVYVGADRCPKCGHWITRNDRAGRDERRQRLWKIVAGLLAVLLILWFILP